MKHKLKVGNRVRLIKSEYDGDDKLELNKSGVIDRVSSSMGFWVIFDKKLPHLTLNNARWHSEGCLELIKPHKRKHKPTKPKLGNLLSELIELEIKCDHLEAYFNRDEEKQSFSKMYSRKKELVEALNNL